ncbi:MAG: DUF262 domain-containing protein [Spirochaetaceae bacterium]|nr:DUF262 domain-containing protein [Spirochaetaceae bacterium]
MSENGRVDWYDDADDSIHDLQVEEYDITVSPNDFSVMTLCSFVERGSVRIPGFQRNFVWDIGRASRLIESLILGLPVPQLFLYEQGKNRFLVIDGQQRLMSIYYFIKKRFPRSSRRADIRREFDRGGQVPENMLHDDKYFQTFNLRLSDDRPRRRNRFRGLNYSTLSEDHKTQLDMRPIRNIVVKQSAPEDDQSSIFEIFNRLNSGGVNLRPQEIRTSMYHSDFYTMLYRINAENAIWRRLVGASDPDLHMKDIEILLRGFAMLVDRDKYASSMVRFLNQFSFSCRGLNAEKIQYLELLFTSFLKACASLPEDVFMTKRGRFNIALYEAVFTVACKQAFADKGTVGGKLWAREIRRLSTDTTFLSAAAQGTTQKANVDKRLERAEALIQIH